MTFGELEQMILRTKMTLRDGYSTSLRHIARLEVHHNDTGDRPTELGLIPRVKDGKAFLEAMLIEEE